MSLPHEEQKADLEGSWCPQKGQYIMICNKTNQVSLGCFAFQLHEHFEITHHLEIPLTKARQASGS